MHNSIRDAIEYEDFSVKDITVENILEVIEYSASQFKQLTKCDEWEEKLKITKI